MTTHKSTFTMEFSLESEHTGQPTRKQIINAVEKRVERLKRNLDELIEVEGVSEAAHDVYGLDESLPDAVVRVPAKYLAETVPGKNVLGFSTWKDISAYLNTDPHPDYRLVSASVINGVINVVWELKEPSVNTTGWFRGPK